MTAPNPHGYGFPNKGYKDATAGRTAWTNIFGPSLFDGVVTWWDALWGGFPMKSFAEKLFAGGVCYGMATSSLAAYQGELDPATFKAGADTLWDLGDYGITPTSGSFSQLPANLKSTIEEYFTAQCAQAATDVREDNMFYQEGDTEYPSTMAQFVGELRTALESGPVYLSLGGMLPGGSEPSGHAVVAYQIDMDSSGTSGRIRIYDNRHPGEQWYVLFDLAGTGFWRYPDLFQTPTRVSFVPLEVVQAIVDAPPGTVDYNDDWVEASADATIRFVGVGGKVTGRVEGVYVEDNPLVRLDPVEDGGLGPHEEDRYAVQGSSTRAFTLQSEGTAPVWASGRGPQGGYMLLVDGALDVSAAYSGTDVSFTEAEADEIRLAVENGSILGQAVFRPVLSGSAWEATAAMPGQGTVRLHGTSTIEVKAGSLVADELLLGTASQMLTVPDLPASRAVRADLQDFDATQGTITLSLDRDGNGSFEATQEVPAQRTVSITFSDIANSPYKTAIQSLASFGIIGGYADGTFRPQASVKRAQFAKMAVLSLDLPVSEGGLAVPFWDVEKPTTSLYPDDYVAAAAAHNLILGYSDGSFRPYVDISRAQLLTIVVRMAERFKPEALSTPPSGWSGTLPASDPTHGANIRAAEHSGLLAGIDLAAFSIWQAANRGEVAQILWNLREK